MLSLKRKLNVIFTKNKTGSQISRITIPTPWIREMNITPEDRQAVLTFDGETITIKKGD